MDAGYWTPLARDAQGTLVSPGMVLHAYRQGLFPMAEHRTGTFDWYRPRVRAVLTPDRWHVPSSLRRLVRKGRFAVEFGAPLLPIMQACADRPTTWISTDLDRLYTALEALGDVHAIAVRDRETGELAGGLYGVRIGACFCGESLFHRRSGAGFVALVTLTEALWEAGFLLHDCQQMSSHVARLGAWEVPHDRYLKMLARALRHGPAFPTGPASAPLAAHGGHDAGGPGTPHPGPGGMLDPG